MVYIPDWQKFGEGDPEETDKVKGIFTGKTLKNDLEEMTRARVNEYQPEEYDPNEAAFQLQRNYSDALQRGINQTRGVKAKGVNVDRGQAFQGAVLNTQPQQKIRASQEDVIAALRARAAGQVPSAAEMQLARGREENIKAAQALAASQPGLSPAAALRQAQDASSRANIAANADAAQLRAAEQAQATSALSQLLGNVRSQDIGLAQGQAQLQQQAGLAGNEFVALEARLQQQRALADQQAQLDQNRLVQQYIAQGMTQDQAQLQANIDLEQIRAQQRLGANQLQANIAEQNTARAQQAQGGLLSGIGGALGSILSDKTAKKQVKKTTPKDMGKVLDALKTYTYKYKKQHDPTQQQHVGVMAQDLEKVAPQFVSERTDGKKQVNMDLGSLIASMVHLNQRLAALEGGNK